MSKTAILGIIIILGWFILGIFKLIPEDIFWTALIAFMIGMWLTVLENQELKRRNMKESRGKLDG